MASWISKTRGKALKERCLTKRELECLSAVASGQTSLEIAEQLGISARTVEHHIASVMKKLGAPTRAAAVARVIHLDLLDLQGGTGAQ